MSSIVLHPVWVLVWFLVASIFMVVGVSYAARLSRRPAPHFVPVPQTHP